MEVAKHHSFAADLLRLRVRMVNAGFPTGAVLWFQIGGRGRLSRFDLVNRKFTANRTSPIFHDLSAN
jgi:hypothetical protein